MQTIGITSSIPLEIPLAAGCLVLDLNNLFISHPQKHRLVEEAEEQGFPRNTCCWIKGIYGIVRETGIKTVIAVTEGDCSNTHALMEVLQSEGVKCIPFAYPYDRNAKLLKGQIEALMQIYGVSWEEVSQCKKNLDMLRAKAWEIDRLTWREDRVSGWENHYYQVGCSDMGGNPQVFERDLDNFIEAAQNRSPLPQKIRLGYLGVPPIFPEIYQFLENLDARVVYNEIQRQFTMPVKTADLVDQYGSYTYPYDVFGRIEDIEKQVKLRHLHGLIHYTQSFCFRQIEDILIRRHLKLPILTIEGDTPGTLDARTKLRLESFIESLSARLYC